MNQRWTLYHKFFLSSHLAAIEISSPKKRYSNLGSYGHSTNKELSEKLKPEAHKGDFIHR